MIHTDIGKNLVKAEVCGFETLMEDGGWSEAKVSVAGINLRLVNKESTPNLPQNIFNLPLIYP